MSDLQKRGRLLPWLLALSLLFNVAVVAAFAARTLFHPHLPPGPHGGPPPDLKERLGLSQEQWDSFRQGRMQMFETVRELRQAARAEKEGLWKLVTAPSPDKKEISAAIDRIAARQKEVQQLVVDNVLLHRASLDAQQRDRYDDFLRQSYCGCPMCDGACAPGSGRGPHPGHPGAPPVPPVPGAGLEDGQTPPPPPGPHPGGCPGCGPDRGPEGCGGSCGQGRGCPGGCGGDGFGF
jgi:Spy/CpxP family protein refolding chaperone